MGGGLRKGFGELTRGAGGFGSGLLGGGAMAMQRAAHAAAAAEEERHRLLTLTELTAVHEPGAVVGDGGLLNAKRRTFAVCVEARRAHQRAADCTRPPPSRRRGSGWLSRDHEKSFDL